MGVCDRAINKTTKEQVGYIICYEIMRQVFSNLTISLKYEDVIDARTRLKEYIQKRNVEQQSIYKYGYNTLNSSLEYTTFVSFNSFDESTQKLIRQTTQYVKTDKKQDGINYAYENFFNMLKNIPMGLHQYISNVQLEQTQTGTVYTGDPTQACVQVYVMINGKQILYEPGYGYNESSAKEKAAENALDQLKREGHNVSIGGWDFNEWI